MVRALFCHQPHATSPLLWVLLSLRDTGIALILRGTEERNRKKKLTKDSNCKSTHAKQVGSTVEYQAPVRAFMVPGHSLDGERTHGGRWDGVIGEKPGIGRGRMRLCFHGEAHSGALYHFSHLPSGYARLQLDFKGVRTIWKDKNNRSSNNSSAMAF